jgi:hypothetical protein
MSALNGCFRFCQHRGDDQKQHSCDGDRQISTFAALTSCAPCCKRHQSTFAALTSCMPCCRRHHDTMFGGKRKKAKAGRYSRKRKAADKARHAGARGHRRAAKAAQKAAEADAATKATALQKASHADAGVSSTSVVLFDPHDSSTKHIVQVGVALSRSAAWFESRDIDPRSQYIPTQPIISHSACRILISSCNRSLRKQQTVMPSEAKYRSTTREYSLRSTTQHPNSTLFFLHSMLKRKTIDCCWWWLHRGKKPPHPKGYTVFKVRVRGGVGWGWGKGEGGGAIE